MGIFPQSTAGRFRYTKDGRRLYARRYLVSDSELERVESPLRMEGYVMIPLVVVLCTIARHQSGELWGWLAILLVFPLGSLSRRWIASGLSIVAVPTSDLVPVDRKAVARAHAEALSRPGTWTLFFLGLGMAALGGVVAFTDGAWDGWFLLVMLSWCSVKMLQQIRQLDQK